jgi:tetratricopeptide (TPR) repeat protein/TolB-like protein/DNA-binding winged helix-turn-helix (wHTH) protein
VNTDLLQGFYLGSWHIDPVKGAVNGRGDSRHLPPKAAEVLLHLASCPGELITHDELLETVWGRDQESHDVLSHAVSEVRRALDDDPDSPRYIQTLPRRGYRLLVEPLPEEGRDASVVIGAGGSTRLEELGLFESLVRRGVFETGLAYLVVGWLLLQVADVIVDLLRLPELIGAFITVLIIAGFPIALVFSWFLEFRDGRAVLDDLSPRGERRRRFSRTYISVVGGMAIAAFGVFVYDMLVGLPRAVTPPPVDTTQVVAQPPILEHSYAVLPFLNLDGSDETQTFADGLVEDLINRLTRVPGLRVASRGDSASLAPNSASKDVRNRLRVEKYVEGSVEMADNEIRVTVQLIDSADGFHILSRTVDRPKQDFFDIRDDITSLLVADVRVALPEKMQASTLLAHDDPSVDAWVLYRKGIDATREPITMDNITAALGFFDAALDIDSEYAAAYAGKCIQYVRAFFEMNETSYIALAQSACSTALDFNPNLDVVHASLGDLYVSTGNYAEAESAYNLALAINPSCSVALAGLGRTYQRTNRPEEAEAILKKAVDIHPGDTAAYSRLGGFLFQTGRYDESATQYEYLVALDPDNMRGLTNLASAYMMQGNFTAAVPALRKAIEIEPTQNAYSNLGMMRFYLGDLEAAIEAHRMAVQLQPQDRLAHSNLADALWSANRTAEAREEYETALSLAETAFDVNPSDPLLLMDLAWIYTALERHDEARVLINRARELAPTDPYVQYIDGLMLHRTGDVDGALQAFAVAVNNGYPVRLLAGDPNLTDLDGDSRFRDIVNGLE